MAPRESKKSFLPIPTFRSEDEEREFWATHDSTDYVDWTKAQRVVFPNLKPSTETISLRLPAGLLADLKVLANRMDVPYQSLLKVYLAERVHQELRRDRTPEQLAAMVREPEPPYGKAPVGTHRPVKRAARAVGPPRRKTEG
jgi:predicted DNA binding CopG/RHH family protein